MSGTRLDDDQREARLREIEAELDSDLGLDSTPVTAAKPSRKTSAALSGLNTGKIALISLAVAIIARVLGQYLVGLIAGIAGLAFLVFGILWLIGQFSRGDD